MAIAYALVAAAWILFSDLLLQILPLRPSIASGLATTKAIIFVVVTAALLYTLLHRRSVIPDQDLDALGRRAADAERIAETLIAPGASVQELVDAHNALAESEARMRMIVGAAAEGIVLCDDEGMILTWNREAQRMFGPTEEEAIGEELVSLIALAREQPSCRELLFSAAANSAPHRGELTGSRRDGAEFPMEMSVIAVQWGPRTLHAVFIRDISDRVRAAHEAEHVAAIVNASADAIFSVSTDGEIVSWNAAAERIFGYDAETARGAPLADLFPAEAADTVQWLQDSIVLGIPIEAAPLDCIRIGNEVFKTFVSVSPIRDDGVVTGAAVVVRDASEQLVARDRVVDAENLASLGRLAAAVGHQFNNVLMGIQPFVDVLKRNELPPQAARAVEQIAKSVQRGRRVTGDIQSFTRAADPPALRSVLVTKWIETLRADLDVTLGSNVDVEVNIDDPSAAITADPAKLRVVLMNLASNARDAMPLGGRFTISVRESRIAPAHARPSDSSWVEIVVRDSGDGIDEETQRRIFEPLFMKKRGGSGLELATVQQIVRSHGGTIDVSSAAGEGTAFRLLLPRAEEAAPDEQVPGSKASAAAAKQRRVLLVEDDTNVALGLTQALVTHGMHVDVVHTGSRVMRAVQTFSPEVVVLDIRLPDADGFEVYRQLAAAWPQLPVIFSTGHADELDVEAALPLKLAHVELLRKPYATETLLAAMERVTARH